MLQNKTLAGIKGSVLSSSSPGREISKVLDRVHFEDYPRLAWYCSQDERLKTVAFGPVFPSSLREIHEWSDLYDQSAEQSMLWIAASVRCFKDRVRAFLKLEREFGDLTLAGRHVDAGAVLDRVEAELGNSVWLLESRIANLELQGGVKDQKQFVKMITEDETVPSSIRTIAYYTSYRAEASVTADRYFETVLKAFPEEAEDENSSTPNMIFRLAFFSRQSFLHIKPILVFEGRAALVDRYLTLVRVIQLVFSDSRHSNSQKLARGAALALAHSVEDPRLEAVLRFSGALETLPGHRCLQFLDSLDKYTIGDYVGVLSSPASSFDVVSRIAAVEIRAKASLRAEMGPPTKVSPVGLDVGRIESLLTTALAKGQDCLEAHASLLKLVLLIPQSNWAGDLFGCLSREFRQISEDRRGRYSLFGQFNGSPASPRLFARAVRPPQWIVQRSDTHGKVTYQLLNAVERGGFDEIVKLRGLIPEARLAKYQAIAHLNSANPHLAAAELVGLLSSRIPLDREDAIEGLVRCLQMGSAPLEVFDRLVVELAENPGFLTRIDVIGMWAFARANFRSGGPLQRSMAVPVLCDICYGKVGTITDGERAALFEDYLNRTGAMRPTRVDVPPDDVGRRLFVQLLRRLAVPAVLDSHIEYESSQQVEDERVAVCQLLTTLDVDRAVAYSDEIARITRAQFIQRGVRQVEKSKIYVDIAGLQSGLRASARDLFERYRSLPILSSPDLGNLVLRIGKELNKRGVKLLVSLPRNERAAAFNELFWTIRDRFVSSNEHGLDVYLSVGIRHGTLAGQLRSVFEREGLLGRRSAEGTFVPPQRWTNCFSDLSDAPALETLSDELERFSDGVDSQIRELRDKFIQINSETKPNEGWFDFRFTTSDLFRFEARTQQIEDFDAFSDVVIDFLWQRTEINLSRIRSGLTSGIRGGFEALLDKLNEVSSQLPVSMGRMQFQAAIARVRPMMQSELASIAAWFTRHGTGDADPYRIDTALDIARTMFDRCNPAKRLQLTVPLVSEARMLNGRTLPGMVDIFYLLLDNVGKYGRGEDGSELRCDLHYTIAANSIEVTLENPVDELISRDKRSQVQMIVKEVELDSDRERVKREGGTGLLKLAKIVRVDFGSELRLSAAYPRKDLFKVSFSAIGGKPLT